MTPMIVEHPLLQHKLSILRNKQTGTKEFRDLVCEMETPPVCYFDYFFHSADIRSLLRGAGVDRQKGSVFGAN